MCVCIAASVGSEGRLKSNPPFPAYGKPPRQTRTSLIVSAVTKSHSLYIYRVLQKRDTLFKYVNIMPYKL